MLKSGRDEIKKLYGLKVKENNKLENEIQKLKDLKAQEAMTVNLSKLNKFDKKELFITSSNLPTGDIYKPIYMNIDDKKQSEKSINPATAGFLIKNT